VTAPASGQRGYSLVILLVLVAVLNVLVAAALPYWSTAMKRDKEEELVFRGLQYAEGIRLFQRRFGRLPVRLEELIEVEPRCMRQLYEDPMSEDGEWGLLFAGQPPGQPPGPGQNEQQGNTGANPVPTPTTGPDGAVTVGPISGVYSRSEEESLMKWNGEESYDRWHFTVDLVSAGMGGGQQQNNNPDIASGTGPAGRPIQAQPEVGAMVNLRWLGRPLPEGVQQPGIAPGAGPQDGNLPGQAGGNLVPGGSGLDDGRSQ
jgi:type II secretory pathway pseudopilin PulG